MARKKKDEPKGAPEWMVTYGDMMSLLLCFFVMLVAMSEIKEEEKFQKVLESLQETFGYAGSLGSVPSDTPPEMSLIKRLESIVIPRKIKQLGDSDDEGIDGRVYRVTQVREGVKVAMGGRISFDRFSAELKPEARQLVAQLAEKIRGFTYKVSVRGHATHEPLPGDSLFQDPTDLSYARARAVGRELARHGVDAQRIRLTACGATEPLVRQAYDERRRSLNRRVEIIVDESIVKDYQGDRIAAAEIPSDGRTER